MRTILPNLGLATRSISTSFGQVPRPLLVQTVNPRTTTAALRPHRGVSSSRSLLRADGETPKPPVRAAAKEEKTKDDNYENNNPANQQQKRRKPPLRGSLHRVAIVAQKGKPGPKPTPSPEKAIDAAEGSSTISAVCVADAFDMEKVVDILSSHNFTLDPDNSGFELSEVVHARGLNNGDIFVFPSGTVVTWALPPDVVNTLATKHLLPAAEQPFVENKEVEDLEFISDPEVEESRVIGDVVVLGTRREQESGEGLDTTLAKIAFSSGLARSTKLAVLESSLTRYLESTRSIPDRLSQGLRAPLSRDLILKKAGELLNLRSQLNHYNDLTDALPDIFWDTEEKLETYYAKIGKALDVGVRIKTLNDKMTYAQEVINMTQGVLDTSEKMSSEKHSTRLEWIIIILIAIEVGFELRRLYMEREDDFEERLLGEVRGLREEVAGLKGERK